MKMSIKLTLILLIFLHTSNCIPVHLIKSYFLWRNIGSLNGFLCNTKDGVDFLKLITNKKPKLVASVHIGDVLQGEEFFKVFTSKQHPTGTFLDLSCKPSKLMFYKEFMLNMTNAVLIYGQNFEQSFKYVENSTVAHDSDLAILDNEEVFDMHKINQGYPVKVQQIGFRGLNDILFSKRNPRLNLEQTWIKSVLTLPKLRLNYSLDISLQILDRSNKPEIDVLARFPFSVYKLLEKLQNFKYQFNITNNWGYYNKSTGHFDPGTMFSALENQEIEVGLTSSRIFTRRLDVALYIPPFDIFRSCFMFKHPSTLAAYTAFTMPFTYQSWACTLAIIFLAGLVLRMIRQFDVKDEPPNEPSFPASLLLVVGTMCQQGLYIDSLRLPTRVLSVFIEVTSLLVYSYYGAKVVGFLLAPSPKTINTLDKLIASPIDLYVENVNYHVLHLTSGVNEKTRKAYQSKVKGDSRDKDKFINLKAGIAKMQRGGVAMYSLDTNLYTVIDNTFSNADKCALSEIEMIRMWTSSVIRKKSPFKEITYKGIQVLIESGHVFRQFKKWYIPRPACIGQEVSDSVKLEATLVAQIIYYLGVLLALFIYVLEWRLDVAEHRVVELDGVQFQN